MSKIYKIPRFKDGDIVYYDFSRIPQRSLLKVGRMRLESDYEAKAKARQMIGTFNALFDVVDAKKA